jgi:quercetin dioxygenase-like cupin family protein
MRIVGRNDVQPQKVTADQDGNPAHGASIQVLIPEGPNFIMRLFTIEPGGSTPLHKHPWEHEVYIVSGTGETRGEHTAGIAAGDAVYVAGGDMHCFANTGDEALQFICVVPKDQ